MDKPENERNRSKKEKQTTYFHGNQQVEKSKKEELVKESKGWRLPTPDSSDTKDIQKAAAQAAEIFRPLKSEEEESVVKDQSTTPDDMFFMDEEALFCMPGLLTNMAEGLMVPPPQCTEMGDHVEADDMPLWSYSI